MATDCDPVQSPCISVCSLDENNVCLGCYRNLDEIKRWGSMTEGEKRDVMGLVADRELASRAG